MCTLFENRFEFIKRTDRAECITIYSGTTSKSRITPRYFLFYYTRERAILFFVTVCIRKILFLSQNCIMGWDHGHINVDITISIETADTLLYGHSNLGTEPGQTLRKDSRVRLTYEIRVTYVIAVVVGNAALEKISANRINSRTQRLKRWRFNFIFLFLIFSSFFFLGFCFDRNSSYSNNSS